MRKQSASTDSPPTSSTSSSSGNLSPPQHQDNAVISTPLHALTWNVEDQGLQFFFAHFGMSPWLITEESHSDFSTRPLVKLVGMDEAVHDAVLAVSLSALFNVTNNPRFLLPARQKYDIAINTVRNALKNPHRVPLSQTTRIIAMLAMFEVCPSDPHIPHATYHLKLIFQGQKIASQLQYGLCGFLDSSFIRNSCSL
jgi:hypothetical protein